MKVWTVVALAAPEDRNIVFRGTFDSKEKAEERAARVEDLEPYPIVIVVPLDVE